MKIQKTQLRSVIKEALIKELFTDVAASVLLNSQNEYSRYKRARANEAQARASNSDSDLAHEASQLYVAASKLYDKMRSNYSGDSRTTQELNNVVEAIGDFVINMRQDAKDAKDTQDTLSADKNLDVYDPF